MAIKQEGQCIEWQVRDDGLVGVVSQSFSLIELVSETS